MYKKYFIIFIYIEMGRLCVIWSFRFNTWQELVLCSRDFNLQCPGVVSYPIPQFHWIQTQSILYYIHCSKKVTFIPSRGFRSRQHLEHCLDLQCPLLRKWRNTHFKSVIWSIDGFLIFSKYFPLASYSIVCFTVHMSI